MASLSLGIDIGGTFTDIVLYDPDRAKVAIVKESTTPDDPARGVVEGTRRLIEREGIDPGAIGRVVHATTLFTNALIERKGARTGLITTEGFRDVLEIGRERKYELYDVFIEMPEPLVPRNLRREVPERLDISGAVEVPLDRAALMREIDALVADGVESVAIVFLHSYANPEHEREAAALIAERHPHLSLTASCDIAPEIREYPRASTAVVNAYVKPLAETYLERLAAELRRLGIGGSFFLMLSNGGLTHIEEAKRAPVRLLESGPAAGALAGAYFGASCGVDELIAFDMGGTTAKICLVEKGEPMIAYAFEAAREKRFMEGSGLPIQISTIELIEIGAGGGSIARVDELGLLKVGPESSGAMPGPACYARGGTAPTVTDSDLLLGRLDADFFLGGAMKIDGQAAVSAIGDLAGRLGVDGRRAAWGIHDVVNEGMAGAARVHLAERGREPRSYALLATGGAAPVHAYNVARKLGLSTVICPPAAGVGSTIGLLMAPARIDRVVSHVTRVADADWDAIERAFRRLEDDATGVLVGTGADLRERRTERAADMRYVGQGSEIVVSLPPGPYGTGSAAAIVDAFEETYRTLFARLPPDVAIEIVNLRASVSAPVASGSVELTALAEAGHADGGRKGSRPVYFEEADGFVETVVFDRYRLAAGQEIEGPAVFEENESTFVIGPGARCRVAGDGSLIATLPSEERS